MLIDPFHGGADRGQGRGDLRHELLVFSGERDAACRPVEQANAQTRFQSRHGVAQRRGGHVQLSRRNPEAIVASDRHDGFEFQLARPHCTISCINLCHVDRLIRSVVGCHIPSTNQRRRAMRTIDTVYIDGQFVTPHGEELFDLFNPATEEKIGQVRLGDAIDAKAAVAAAKRAFPAYSRTSKAERIALLRRLHDAVAARSDALAAAMTQEYGAPRSFVNFSATHAANLFLDMAETIEAFEFTQTVGGAKVTLQPMGVVAAISPWNSNIGSICSKLATALAAGCTFVIKPSEMSALQTQVLAEALHEAGA